jgi:Tol biopolymer transport system component
VLPSFSPDGTQIAFSSGRDGSGGSTYVVSTLGGEERLLVKPGHRPKFSPDGNWIAYTVEGTTNDSKKIYLVPTTGGPSRQLQPDFASAMFPIWTSDGKHLLFWGIRDFKEKSEQSHLWAADWWVAPLEGGPAIQTWGLHRLPSAGISPHCRLGAAGRLAG